MGIQCKIGGFFKPPLKNYKFYVDDNYEWIKLKIHANKPKWFQVLLWDSEGILRLQYLYGKTPKTIIIHKDKSKTSSAAVPRIVTKGEWEIEAFGLNDGEEFEFNIDIQAGTGEINSLEKTQLLGDELWVRYEEDMTSLNINNYKWNKQLKKEKGWYKGDFHTHTNISDGKLTPLELLEQAEKQKLDFFVTTEHNIIHTGFPKSKILVIPGIEITDEKGHFNALGIKNWIDWTVDSKDGGLNTEEGMNRLLMDAGKAGALRSINHPTLIPWAWRFKETLLENIDTIEIWNDPTYHDNDLKATEEALRLWDTLWQNGYRIWGIGGSDAHNFPNETYEGSKLPSIIGDPGTFVFSNSLSASDIIQGAAKGRVYVSRGPVMELIIEADGFYLYPGSDLTEIMGEEEKQIKYIVKLSNFIKNYNLLWIENGLVKEEQRLSESGENHYIFNWKGKEYKWLRVEIRDENKKLIAFVNPIYKGYESHKVYKWGELVEATGGIKLD